MSPQDPQAAALLAHVVSQIEQNVNFLASHNYISQSDASAIMTKLPNTNAMDIPEPSNNGTFASLTQRFANMPTPSFKKEQPSARPVPPAPTGPATIQAKALWDYSEDPNDLQFSAGDIIEIIEESNADWWTGRCHGRQGLFPATYVQKIANQAPNAPARPYKPFGAALHGADVPPPSGQGTNSLGLQEAGDNKEKKDKFGKYKNTLAHSAVGGVGFGAGSAIGGGLVRAIF